MKQRIGRIILLASFVLFSISLVAQNLPPPLEPPTASPAGKRVPPKRAPAAAPAKKNEGSVATSPATMLRKGCYGQIAEIDPDRMKIVDFASGSSCTFTIGEVDVAGFSLGDMIEADVDRDTRILRAIKKAEVKP